MNKIALLVGTRPEIIKMSPVIRALQTVEANWILIHSNQHYSPEMDEIFFQELNLPKPHFNLEIKARSHVAMTAEIMTTLEAILEKELPDWLLVQGDTNTALAGGIAASKRGIKIGHVEAGLRSYDRSMPEEINRIIVDHLSDLLFAPTRNQKNILLKEGIPSEKIKIVGNTVVDALYQHLDLAEHQSLQWTEKEYALATLHRPANVDESDTLKDILTSLGKTSKNLRLPIMFLVHPRTKRKIEEFGLTVPDDVREIRPLGYLQMLKAIKNAQVVITDSGGVQEEACILQVPCVTLRTTTERPETIEVGANILSSCDDLIKKTQLMLNVKRNWNNPFGDGKTAKKILSQLSNHS